MIDQTTLITYLAVLLGFVFIPGPAVILTLARASTSGTRVGIATGLGIAVGDLVHTAMAVVGLSAVILASAFLFTLVKYLGAAYLVYLGIRAILEKAQPDAAFGALRITPGQALRQAVLAEVLNPKSALFFLAFLPQFVPANAPHATASMLWLAIVFMVLTFIVFVGYGAFASATRRYVISKPRVMQWLRRGFAGAFGALGLRLALSER